MPLLEDEKKSTYESFRDIRYLLRYKTYGQTNQFPPIILSTHIICHTSLFSPLIQSEQVRNHYTIIEYSQVF